MDLSNFKLYKITTKPIHNGNVGTSEHGLIPSIEAGQLVQVTEWLSGVSFYVRPVGQAGQPVTRSFECLTSRADCRDLTAAERAKYGL